MGSDNKKIGVVGEQIVKSFNLPISPDTPIYIGLNNRIHMENNHGEIYRQYSDRITEIIESPDYVGLNPHDQSLEYYKDYGEITIHIKLAVRPTKNGVYYAKTMYDINEHSLKSYLKSGRIKSLKDNGC